MYVPSWNRETGIEVLHELMHKHSFAILVSHSDGQVMASHLPLVLDPLRGPHGVLRGHVARANPHWQWMAGSSEALAIFQGPHAYVSPSWYQNKLSVPTWNYIAIHAYGRPRLLEPLELSQLLRDTVEVYESGFTLPWSMESLPEDLVQKQMGAIVGFEIEITRLEGKLKLSQNRAPEDQRGVIEGLSQTQRTSDRDVADLMACRDGR